MRRPTGVTVLAILLFLNAAYCICILMIMYLHPPIWQALAGPRLQQLTPNIHTDDGAFAFFVLTIEVVVSVVVGYGIWNLSSWARWSMLFLTGIPLGRYLISTCTAFLYYPSNVVLKSALGTASLLWMIACAAVVYYLIQPQVQWAFADSDSFIE
jgi:hypothetical protein